MTKKNEGLHMVKLHMGLTINVTSINMIFLNFIVIYKNLQLQCGSDVVSNLHELFSDPPAFSDTNLQHCVHSLI